MDQILKMNNEENLILKNLIILKNFLKGFSSNSNHIQIKSLFKNILNVRININLFLFPTERV